MTTDQANINEITPQQKAIQLLHQVTGLPDLKLSRADHKAVEAAFFLIDKAMKENVRLNKEIEEVRASLGDSTK